jgi:hypothetical protein
MTANRKQEHCYRVADKPRVIVLWREFEVLWPLLAAESDIQIYCRQPEGLQAEIRD